MNHLTTARRAACAVALSVLAATAIAAIADLVLPGRAVAQTPPPAPARISVWSHSSSAGNSGLDWSGSDNQAYGVVHSNSSLKLSGSNNNMRAAVRYVTTFQQGGSNNQFAEPPAKVAVQPLPYAIDVASYAPGGPVQQQLGAAYFDKSSVCASKGKWDVSDSQLPLAPGVYYAPCEVQISGSLVTGRSTIVSTRKVQISGSQVTLTPFYRGLQIATSTTSVDSIKLSGSRLEIGGLLWAPNGSIEPSGSEGKFSCGIIAGTFKLAGAKNTIGNGPCGSAPDARDSAVTTPEDTAVAFVLDAADADLDLLGYEIVTAPAHGTLSGTAPALTYTPSTNYHGPDFLVFRVVDSFGQTDTARVTITVTPVNDAPLADPQSLVTNEDTPLPIVLTGSDIEQDPLSFTVTSPPAHGTLTGTAPNLVYTPVLNYFGPDAFEFRSNDGRLDSAPARVTIDVLQVNHAPSATPQSLTTDEDTPLPILLGGSDPDADALQFAVVGTPLHGTLGGTPPNLVYTPAPGFFGDDSFNFRTNDGQLDSPPARIDIRVLLVNRAPTIATPPVTLATEGVDYRYDVDATDPDNDRLAYALPRTPQALAINPDSGVIGGPVDSSLVQPVRAFNAQCYVLPDDVDLEGGDGTVIAPLFQRVRSAITKGSGYVAPQTLAWHRQNGCLGCHVQNQTLLGLQGSMERAAVDEAAAEYLLAEILASQQADGSIRRSHPEFSRTQTAFALWALSYVPDRARTLAARERGLRFFMARVQNSGVQSYWTQDHDSGWLSSADAATALVALTADRYLRDVSRLPTVTAGQIALGLQVRALLPRVAEYFLARPAASGDNLALSFAQLGLGQVAPHLDDAALRARVSARIAQLDATLRGRALASGGWHRSSGSVGDPLTSAWVGFALDTLDPPLTDPVVLRNIEFLLDNQRADGTWPTNSGLFTTHLGTTGLVMAYLPVALEHLGNPDLTLGHMTLVAEGTGYRLTAEAINRGLADVGTTSVVRFFAGREASGTLLGETPVAALRSGETRVVSILLDALPAGDVSASISGDAIDECVDDNNTTRAALMTTRATDPYGLFDSQSWLLNLEDANAAPQITSQPVTSLEQGRAYEHQVTVSDPDVGDAHEYSLTVAPAGLFINPLNGRFSYDLATLAPGAHAITVRVTDLRGATAVQSFQLTVVANRAPDITSTPSLQVFVGAQYTYDVDAIDPDNDTLRYRLDGAPLTMTIDAVTGVIRWTPGALHVGNQAVAVVVEDGRGGSDRQAWTIKVEMVAVNRAPTITSTPVARVDEGETFRYPITAVDPDNDALAYRATTAPSGTTVGATTGALAWPAADALVGSVRESNLACRTATSPAAFDPVVRWHWSGSTTLPGYDQAMSSPVVVPLRDSNGDGRVDGADTPDVAFVSYGGGGADYGDGVVRLVRGTDGTEIFTVSDPTARVPSYANLAAADLDGDGIAEIIAPLQVGGVMAVDRDGRVLWKNTAGTFNWNIGGASIADLEGDGVPEILLGRTVYSATGQIKWQGSAPYQGNSHASPIGTLSVAADLRPEPGLEVVSGPSMYSASGTLLWRYDALGDGATAIGDVDGDGQAEVVLVAAGQLALLRADGSVRWGPVSLGDSGRGGAPTIADFDADGDREIGVAVRNFYVVFNHDGTLKWKQPIVDFSSNITGSTLFDFDGDGAVEVLQADERKFRVFDGATGRVRLEMDNTNGTAYEFPVVADADHDGSADILLSSNLYYGAPGQKGVRMISSASRAWMPTRSIWNQHAYHVDNIGDDGRVPARAVDSWTTHNTFRLNTFPDRSPLGLPDLALFDLSLDASGNAVALTVVNRGLAPTEAATSVRIHSGDPAQGGTLLGVIDVPALAAGESHALMLAAPAGTAVDRPLYAQVDVETTIAECDDSNNTTAAAYFAVRATDPAGLFDAQRFTVVVDDVNEAPVLVTTALPPAAANQAYTFTVLATDADRGDGLLYSLASAPTGLAIEAVSGELRWTPLPAQNGSHAVRVRVTDLRGASVERNYALVVSDNRPPQITTTPGTTATLSNEYVYDVDATDADGDPLSYSVTLAPTGMQIGGSDGVIRWTPTAPGAFEVEVRVIDDRGGFTLQRWTIQVAAPANHPPTITSSPATTATPGRAYAYLIDATDPDNDVLSVLLPVKPDGMTLNDSTGQLSWIPTAAQLGTHAVRVQVIDGRGGSATQDFSIVVSSGASNLPPAILSTPPFTAKAGRAYSYAVQAEDPNGDALVYSLTQAPTGMTIGNDGRVAWTPAAAGTATVRVRVADAQFFVEQTWTINVLSADVPLDTAVNVSPNPVQPGGQVTIQIAISGAAGQPTVTATLDGQPLPLDADGSTTIVAPTQPGSHTLVVTVNDGIDTDTTTTTFNVVDPSDTTLPDVVIHSPREGATEDLLVITSPQDVIGTVADANLRSWELMLFERGAPGSEGILLASGNATVTNTMVGKLDPTLRQNGQYALVLRAEDASGNRAQDVVAVSIEGAMKLGHFSITFEDVNVPVAGIPVSVTRTYDTRQRHRDLDFGFGWSVGYQNVRVFESRRPGFAWELKTYPSGPFGLIPNYCVESALGNVVSVTLADGDVERFRAVAYPQCNQGIPFLDVELRFEPVDGAVGKLQVLDGNFGRLINGSLADPGDPGTPLDPTTYRYIDAENREFTIDQGFGLRQVQERAANNIVTFGHDGIVHSNGTSVIFERDAADRITRVIAPGGTVLNYEYDASGNLAAFVDAGGDRTTFTYLSGHYLRDIIDPRGIRVSRNEYDDDGRLVAVIDADGNRVEYTHDIEGRVQTVKDRNGGTTVYVYNDRGDVLAQTDPTGRTTHRSYDENGNELSRTDALNRTQTWSYDQVGNTLAATNAAGDTTSYTYGGFNQLRTVLNDAGAVILRNTWRNITAPGTGIEIYAGPLVGVTDAAGVTAGFGYDPATGGLSRTTDGSGASSTYVVDGRGFKIADVDALGHRIDYVNDDLGRVIEQRRSRTRSDGSVETLVTVLVRDDEGQVIETRHADGSVVWREYDGNGNVIAEVDALGRRSVIVLNAAGEVVEVRHHDGSRERKAYDDNGNLVSETDRGGRTTRFVHDAANRLVETILPDPEAEDGDDDNNPRSRNVYDAAGQLVESIAPNGTSTRYAYDAAGRRTRTILAPIDGSEPEIVDEFDSNGRRIASTDAAGHRVELRYDAVGRLLETIAEGASTKVEYDAVGRKLADIDAEGRITRYAYDALGRLVTVVQADPATGANPPLVGGSSPHAATLTTRYGYDELGNRIRQTDAEGRVTRWEFDAMSRETGRVLPDGGRETKEYNAAGELVAHTDFNGRTTRYSYDAGGRLATVDYPRDADVGSSYNAAGERTSVVDGRGTSTRAYDRLGRVVQARDADGGLVEYAYDDNGNLLSRVSPSQSLVYVYDARNRVAQVTRTVDAEMPVVTRYEYDADGNRTAMLGGDGVRTEYAYDSRHRLRALSKQSATGTVLLAMTYTVDATGLRTRVEESDATGLVRRVDYAYDRTRRLVSEVIDHRDAASDRTTTWTHDRVGNRLTQTLLASSGNEATSYRYDANDRLLDETRNGVVTTYAYDDNGNTLSKTSPGAAASFVYDDENRMVEASNAAGITAYGYTADGLRVRQTHTPAGGTPTTTWYVQDLGYAHAQVIEQYEQIGSGAKRLAATFTFADDLVSQTRYSATGTPTTRFVHADGFGSTRWLTNAAGAITDTIDYDAFGNELARSGSTEVEHLYRGESFDARSGLYYLRARWMDPAAGRFTSLDTYLGNSADPASLHKYLYAGADPVNGRDPSGHMTLMETSTAQNVLSTLVVQSLKNYAFDMVFNAFVKNLLGTSTTSIDSIPTTGSIAGAGIVTSFAQMCKVNRKRCFLRGVPTFISGIDMPATTIHVVNSLFGNGTTRGDPQPLPFILVKSNRRYAVSALRGRPGCPLPMAVPVVCDEYPYASTLQGGTINYNLGRVSLQWTPAWEGSQQGNRLKTFYSRAGIVPLTPAGIFLNVGLAVPTGFIDRDGDWHDL